MSSVIVGQLRPCKASISDIIKSKFETRPNPYLTTLWLKEMTELFKKFDRENQAIFDTRFKR